MTTVNWIPLIEANVSQLGDSQPGTYLLSRGRSVAGDWIVHYVGRSDRDVKGPLRSYYGSHYTMFGYVYCGTAQAAYEQECRWYHEFAPSDNDIHPDATVGSWRCPVPGCQYSAVASR